MLLHQRKINRRIAELRGTVNRYKPRNGLEVPIGNVIPIGDCYDVLNLSQDRLNIAVDGRILDIAKGLTGHGNAEYPSDLIDKIVSGLGHETYGIT